MNIDKLISASREFRIILFQFERGRISAAEMDKYIFKTVTRHKYSPEYTEAAINAFKAKNSREYSESIAALETASTEAM